MSFSALDIVNSVENTGEYKSYLETIVGQATLIHGNIEESIPQALIDVYAGWGGKMNSYITGHIGIQIDPRLKTCDEIVKQGLNLVAAMTKKGVTRDRVLITIAGTWEGIKAAHKLQEEHRVNCNVNMVFCTEQALAAAQANCFMITCWVDPLNKKVEKEDSGTKLVSDCFTQMKSLRYPTKVMAGKVNTVDQCKQLCGADFFWLSPKMFAALSKQDANEVTRKLIPPAALSHPKGEFIPFDVNATDWKTPLPKVASELLDQSVKLYSSAANKLESLIRLLMEQE